MDMTSADIDEGRSVIHDFSEWEEFLGDRVQQAHEAGLSDETITNAAFRMGNYLAEQVDPRNQQQRLLKQLWDAGSQEDQRSLARMMVKLVQQTNQTH